MCSQTERPPAYATNAGREGKKRAIISNQAQTWILEGLKKFCRTCNFWNEFACHNICLNQLSIEHKYCTELLSWRSGPYELWIWAWLCEQWVFLALVDGSFNYFFVKPVKHHSHLCWCSNCAAHVLDGWWLMCNWEEVIRRRRRSIIARPISKTKLRLSLRRRRMRRTWVSFHYVDIHPIAAVSIFVILISLWNSCCCDLSWPSSAEDLLIIRHSWGTGGPSTSCVYQIQSLSRSDGWWVL